MRTVRFRATLMIIGTTDNRRYIMKTYTIIANHKVITTTATVEEAMDAVWDDELNTEECPIQIVDNTTGNEIEW